MPPTIKQSSPSERQAIFNDHYFARLEAGEFNVVEEEANHPAPNRAWCTWSIFVVVYEKTTKRAIIKGHRNMRDGKILTKNGLDPKWVLHDDVIYHE